MPTVYLKENASEMFNCYAKFPLYRMAIIAFQILYWIGLLFSLDYSWVPNKRAVLISVCVCVCVCVWGGGGWSWNIK